MVTENKNQDVPIQKGGRELRGLNMGLPKMNNIDLDTALQLKMTEKIEEEKKKEKDKIKAEIQTLNDDATEELKKLDAELKNPQTTDEREKILTEQNEIMDNLLEKIKEYHNKSTGGDIPLPIKAISAVYDFIKDIVIKKIKKIELGTEVANAQLSLLDIIRNEIERIKKDNASIDPVIAQQFADLLVSLSKDIQSKNPTSAGDLPSTTGDLSDKFNKIADGLTNGAKPQDMAKVLGAAPGLAEAAATAAKAGGKPLGEKPLGEKPLGGTETTTTEGNTTESNTTESNTPEAATEAPEPAAEEDDEGQGGGGISRKRSHSKYMNQVSENRNKIFKKELEIINSIRRFHRSHTIRKRDKINSILGLVRKSRNNKNRNHGNTRRHRHNKHKSAKHKKK
jgi:hypothetical protein